MNLKIIADVKQHVKFNQDKFTYLCPSMYVNFVYPTFKPLCFPNMKEDALLSEKGDILFPWKVTSIFKKKIMKFQNSQICFFKGKN